MFRVPKGAVDEEKNVSQWMKISCCPFPQEGLCCVEFPLFIDMMGLTKR